MNNILILGGSSFIGKNLALNFSKKNNIRLFGIGRCKEPHDHFGNKIYDKWIESNSIKLGFLNLQTEPDIIINTIGPSSVSYSLNNTNSSLVSSTDVLNELFEYLDFKKRKIKLIHISSAAVYGHTNFKRINEEHKTIPVSIYGNHKLLSEKICLNRCKENPNIELFIIRPFSVYGNGLKKQIFWDAISKLLKSDSIFWGVGDEQRDFIHISDLYNFIFLLCFDSRSTPGIYNIGSGISTSLKDLITEIKAGINSNYNFKFDGLRDINNPVNLVSDNNLIYDKFNFTAKTSLNTGLQEYIKWYFNEIK